MTDKNSGQSGQSIESSPVTAGHAVHIDHLDSSIDTGGGDFVARVRIINQYIETKTIVSVKSLQTVERLEPTPGKPPYKGMAHFTKADKDVYFGREALSDKLVGRLGQFGGLLVRRAADRLRQLRWNGSDMAGSEPAG